MSTGIILVWEEVIVWVEVLVGGTTFEGFESTLWAYLDTDEVAEDEDETWDCTVLVGVLTEVETT